VALVGENGAGKSTLLKVLAGVLPFERGERTLGAHVAVHYYAQHQLDALDATRTVLEELEAVAPEATHTRLRTILGAFLFSGDSVDKRVAVLSGGEKARLALARMLVRPAALLCLDEPTNHLDLASREVLESALAGFPGTIVFISHDRYFINRIATVVVEVASGVLTSYPGSYDDYLEAKERGVQPALASPSPSARPVDHRRVPATAGRLPSAATGARPPGAAAEPAGRRQGDGAASAPAPPVRVIRKRGTAEIRELKRRVEDLERQIHALERRIAEIGAMLTNPKLYVDGDRVRAVSRERKEAEERMSGLLREWEDLATSLAGHE
jgi:ATP-binding cassette subfamily F protein 3